ncbi:unnamed protein product [Somion occarium]|uniref:Uncharacterized protein n=1 Tax=Somion occarium TaxID=3059160 RepID=A0ABP1D3G5_9APHY
MSCDIQSKRYISSQVKYYGDTNVQTFCVTLLRYTVFFMLMSKQRVLSLVKRGTSLRLAQVQASWPKDLKRIFSRIYRNIEARVTTHDVGSQICDVYFSDDVGFEI